MAADVTSDMEYPPMAGCSISLSGDDAGALRGYWEKLSASGTTTMPMQKQAWGDEFGMCVQRVQRPVADQHLSAPGVAVLPGAPPAARMSAAQRLGEAGEPVGFEQARQRGRVRAPPVVHDGWPVGLQACAAAVSAMPIRLDRQSTSVPEDVEQQDAHRFHGRQCANRAAGTRSRAIPNCSR